VVQDRAHHRGTNEGDIQTRLSSKEGFPTTKRRIEDHGFSILQESAQRPRGQLPENIADKKRKLTESSEVIKARKAMKL
jgi:hypothetical protein